MHILVYSKKHSVHVPDLHQVNLTRG